MSSLDVIDYDASDSDYEEWPNTTAELESIIKQNEQQRIDGLFRKMKRSFGKAIVTQVKSLPVSLKYHIDGHDRRIAVYAMEKLQEDVKTRGLTESHRVLWGVDYIELQISA